LLSLVNNVLDISKIESGKIEFERREFELEKLLKENISMLSLRAEEKNISLNITKTPFIETFLIGDPFRLTQILNNLLGNAVKFTDKGKVELSVELLNESNTELELNFIVTDTGPGISPNKQESIFESFTQASIETARKFGGTGLGLSISKQLINLQGGEIGVESSLGKGASFHFTLKFKKGKNLLLSEAISSSSTVNSLLGLRILVAEDNIFNTKVLTRFLELWQAEYEVAENGEMVLSLLEQNNFDLILMDLHMPQMDGYEATRIIRESGNNIYIMALTASANFNSNDEIKSKGFDSYLYKPVNTRDLFNKLKEIQISKSNRES
ncbi:MAG: response regulator, partial [Opitutaceae bacterium]|nr:response regulator [Cytophagales bacterium]